MSLGQAPKQGEVFSSSTKFCREHLSPTSLYALLHEQSHRLFADESFADLFAEIGRWSVPPRIVAVVMVLQRLEGLSDRDAVERFSFDLRWKYAAGGLDFDYPEFVHTVLVDMRARLRRSERPNRIFETSLEVARSAGLVGRKRVLDSTPMYDAVATQDTVTLIRSAIRALLKVSTRTSRPSCERSCGEMTTTSPQASLLVTGKTNWRVKPSSMRWRATSTPRFCFLMAASFQQRCRRRRNSSPQL